MTRRQRERQLVVWRLVIGPSDHISHQQTHHDPPSGFQHEYANPRRMRRLIASNHSESISPNLILSTRSISDGLNLQVSHFLLTTISLETPSPLQLGILLN